MPTGWQLRSAVRCLRAGGVVAYPTEAVYGLGCDPFDHLAVTRLLDIKRRPVGMGLILVATDFQYLAPLVETLPDKLQRRVLASWPGPVTWIWPAQPWVPRWLRGDHAGLAVRVTDHPVAGALCRAWGGPLVSTSANRSGHPPARSALTVQQRLGSDVDWLLHGPVGASRRPTEIRDALSGRIVRPG
ncbi:MAG: L-threonylcarbamoyladenylate synthase [Gammaproteobacteria bacterium]